MPKDTETTLFSMLAECVEQFGDKPALQEKQGDRWRTSTWAEFAERVSRAASALIDLGIEPGDRVIQVAENRSEWIVCDSAIQFIGAVHVPVHAPLTGPQIAYQINDSGARVVVVSGDEQAEKLDRCCGELSSDLTFVTYDPCRPVGGKPPRAWAELTADASERSLGPAPLDAMATILYTSGTTGEPKGVMLSQRNLVTNTLATLQAFEQRTDDTRLTFLPFSHIFGRTCDIYIWLATGAQLALAESRETVIADCAQIKPTLLNGVPLFFDRVRRHLEESGRADEEGSLRQLLGGRMRFCCSGGAALPDHVFVFFERHGIPILQGYGLTETSPVITASTMKRNRSGCVGPPIPDVEVKIAGDGEILTRGPHVMLGYYNNEVTTAEVIRDGWFYTGDLGALDDDGLLRITGRKKEIIVTAGGKNVAPVLLESLLTEDPLMVQALVIGDDQKFLTALIVPDPDHLKSEIQSRQISVFSRDAALRHPDVIALYQSRIQTRLANLSHYEQIRKFTLLDHGFTIERGELTPKLSLRRKVIESNHAELIAAMYAE